MIKNDVCRFLQLLSFFFFKGVYIPYCIIHITLHVQLKTASISLSSVVQLLADGLLFSYTTRSSLSCIITSIGDEYYIHYIYTNNNSRINHIFI